ncbi:hypothetical protein INT45_003504 [Circinella minor]|uniref:DDE-1 domain-containing protein n=1 Tax=Circinella minor TaxID=1195481 RepID=A0A8H7V649_9FUNG|nr:hypothetical protein INT45_003504 [Circinella minor]
MVAINNRKRLSRNRKKNAQGRFISKQTNTQESDKEKIKEDWELLGLTSDDMKNVCRKLNLSWKKGADSGLRGVYQKDSRTTKCCQGKSDKSNSVSNVTSHSILSFSGFEVQKKSTTNCEERIKKEQQKTAMQLKMQQSLNTISLQISPKISSQSIFNAQSSYNICRLQCVHHFLTYSLQGMNKTQASAKAANELWSNPSSYRPYIIQAWAKEYINFGFISPHRQGKHAKRSSLLNDEDVARKGYKYRANKKDVYFDGHERTDVVEYRNEWSKRMMEYKKLMKDFTEGSIIEPNLEPNQQEHVLVTQDECTFYSNDSKRDMWLMEGENLLLKKNPGMSIMVSEFQCPCHGTMRIKGWTSRKLFCAGQNRDGYWDHQDLLKQLQEDVIPLFESLHPNAKGIFIFDQSSNHGAYANNALVASRMPLGPKPADEMEPFKFKDTTYIRDEELHVQAMYIKKDIIQERKNGKSKLKKIIYFKGIQKILEERGLWMEQDPYRQGKKWRLSCNDDEKPDHKCCARHLLANQPDFKKQKSALQETVEQNHVFEMYPKFHCETNWIERYWSYAKKEARANCDYSFKSLQKNVDKFLDSAGDIKRIQNYYNRCWRYIEAYSLGMDAIQAMDEVKRFLRRVKAHRKIPEHM